MVIPVGYAQVNMLFTGAAVPRGAQVTFGTDTGPVEAPLTPTAIGSAVISAWSAHLDGHFSNAMVLSGVRVKFGPVETGPEVVVAGSDAGDLAGPPDSPQVALLVSKVTLLGGRRHKGRMFFPGITEGQTGTGGVVNGVDLTGLQNAFDLFLNALNTAGIQMVLLHNSVAVSPTIVTDLVVNSQLATQRRRLRKV